ncbi:MAG TPA: hypothetical protein VF650_04970 [Allosphingosinicella sp.]
MRLALVTLALALPAASSAEAPQSRTPPVSPSAEMRTVPTAPAGFVPSRICGDDMRPRTARSPESAKPRRLGELPGGDLTLAVVNRLGDCMEPIVVRHGVGGVGSLGR